MNKRFATLVIAIAVLTVSVNTQKSPPTMELKMPSGSTIEPFPGVRNFAFILTVHSDETSTLTIQSSEESEFLRCEIIGEFFSKYHRLQNPKNLSKSPDLPDPLIIVKPSPMLKLGSVVDLIRSVRVSLASSIWVDTGYQLKLAVPQEPDPAGLLNVRPYPLTLVVAIDDKNGLRLNGERHGSLEELSARLKYVFLQREINGVFRRVGSSEIEKSVFLKMPRSAGFSDLINVSLALREAGASPIGLQVDDLDP